MSKCHEIVKEMMGEMSKEEDEVQFKFGRWEMIEKRGLLDSIIGSPTKTKVIFNPSGLYNCNDSSTVSLIIRDKEYIDISEDISDKIEDETDMSVNLIEDFNYYEY